MRRVAAIEVHLGTESKSSSRSTRMELFQINTFLVKEEEKRKSSLEQSGGAI